MTYNTGHFYLTVRGTSCQGAEQWQFGLRASPGTAALGQNATVALAAASIVENWWRGTGYTTGTDKVQPMDNCKLTELKVASIDTDGEYLAGSVAYSHFYLPAIAGSYVTWTGWVPQATVCATLTTAVPRGLASHGRIYLPPNGQQSIDASGTISAATALIYANNVKKLITDLNGLAEIGVIAVYSKGHGVKVEDPVKKKYYWTYPNAGVESAVTGVRVGRVVDTQRRRRRSLGENPQGVSV